MVMTIMGEKRIETVRRDGQQGLRLLLPFGLKEQRILAPSGDEPVVRIWE